MVPPSFNHSAPIVPGLQWYRGVRTELQGKELWNSECSRALTITARKEYDKAVDVL